MTDTDIVMPEFGDPVIDELKTFPCSTCGKVFNSPQALAGHRMVHVPASPCPECGRDDFATAISMARHRTMEHGVEPAYKKKQQASAKPPVKATRVDKGMSVDHIFNSVVLTLYPNGSMPTKVMAPLMEWREATRKLLETVQGE